MLFFFSCSVSSRSASSLSSLLPQAMPCSPPPLPPPPSESSFPLLLFRRARREVCPDEVSDPVQWKRPEQKFGRDERQRNRRRRRKLAQISICQCLRSDAKDGQRKEGREEKDWRRKERECRDKEKGRKTEAKQTEKERSEGTCEDLSFSRSCSIRRYIYKEVSAKLCLSLSKKRQIGSWSKRVMYVTTMRQLCLIVERYVMEVECTYRYTLRPHAYATLDTEICVRKWKPPRKLKICFVNRIIERCVHAWGEVKASPRRSCCPGCVIEVYIHCSSW